MLKVVGLVGLVVWIGAVYVGGFGGFWILALWFGGFDVCRLLRYVFLVFGTVLPVGAVFW